MQTAHQAATLALSSASNQPMTGRNASSEQRSLSTLPTELLAESLIRRVWLRMAEIYGHKWTSAFGDDAMAGAGETWAKALRGLTTSQLALGIESCAEAIDPWPPTLPQFKALCLGIPELHTVSREMRDTNGKRSRFTLLVWKNLDGYRYRQSTVEQSDRLLRDAYEIAREHIMRGGALPDLPAAELSYAAEERKPGSPDVAAEHLARTAEILSQNVP